MRAKVKKKKKKSGNMHTTTKANCAPLPHKSAWKVMSQNQGFQSLIGELLFKYCPLIAMGSMFGDRETERAIPDDKQPLVSCFLPSIMLIWPINSKQQKLPKTCLGYSCSPKYLRGRRQKLLFVSFFYLTFTSTHSLPLARAAFLMATHRFQQI